MPEGTAVAGCVHGRCIQVPNGMTTLASSGASGSSSAAVSVTVSSVMGDVHACECFGGWKGLRCTEPVCADDDCGALVRRGECVAPGSCRCLQGWRGVSCSEPSCPLECSGRGKCVDDHHDRGGRQSRIGTFIDYAGILRRIFNIRFNGFKFITKIIKNDITDIFC
jgi:hypothetical protein